MFLKARQDNKKRLLQMFFCCLITLKLAAYRKQEDHFQDFVAPYSFRIARMLRRKAQVRLHSLEVKRQCFSSQHEHGYL